MLKKIAFFYFKKIKVIIMLPKKNFKRIIGKLSTATNIMKYSAIKILFSNKILYD
jgi:hypothetical protein